MTARNFAEVEVKKVLLGCGLFVFVGTLALVGAMYFFVYRPAAGFVEEMQEVAAVFEEVGNLAAEIENTQPFEAPEDGLLTVEQVGRFVAVQRAVAGTGDGEAYLQRVEDFEETADGDAESAGEAFDRLRQLPERLRMMGEGLIELKRSQIAALNEQGFSADEYSWVKRSFYFALGFSIVPSNLEDMQQQLEVVGQGPGSNVELDLKAPTGAVEAAEGIAPEANRELVAEYRDEAMEWMRWAPFDL